MKELGITKGEWFWDGDPSNYDPEEEAPWLVAGDRAEKIVICGRIEIANKKDAELIADAGNTAQKCGLLPSELLQQRDELRVALQNACKFIKCTPLLKHEEDRPRGLERWESLIEAAIKNTEG